MAVRYIAPKTKKILTLYYQAHPGPVNITTNVATDTAITHKHHPYHIRAQRQLAAFDPDKLYIAVRAPKSLSKSGFVRSRAVHRFRSTLSDALRKNGWNWDGTAQDVVKPKDGMSKEESKSKFNLSGAYAVALVHHDCLTANTGRLRVECDKVMSTMIYNQVHKPQKKTRVAGVGKLSDLPFGHLRIDYGFHSVPDFWP